MTTTRMEPITPAVDETEIAQPGHYLPAAPAVAGRLPAAWVPLFATRERRLFTGALAGALLVAVAGIGALYVDDTNNQATIRSLQSSNESLTGRSQNLGDQLKSTQTNLTATLGELATTKAELAHPQLTLWNVPQQLKGPTWYLAGGIPDTFTYHLEATSTGPMSVSILTLKQWVDANDCVQNTRSTINYCAHRSGVVMSFLNVTSVNYDFHQAEGCADYLAVFTAATAVTVTPNVSVTYNPASTATGSCS